VNGGLYLWNESRQPDGIDLHISISFDNGLNIDVGEDWVDFLVATGEGAVAGGLIMTPGGQAAGVSMAASLLSDQVGNLVTGDDFNATEHLIEGAFGAASGGTSKLAVEMIENSAMRAGLSEVEAQLAAAALNSGFWGGAKGGVKAKMRGENVRRGIVYGAGKAMLSGVWAKGASVSSGIVTSDSSISAWEKGMILTGQKIFIKSSISAPGWIYRHGMEQQRRHENFQSGLMMY